MIIAPRRRRPQASLVKLRNPTAIPVEGSGSGPDLSAGLIVEYADTADMPDGRCLPPLDEGDDAVWRVIRRLPGARTCWRRIRL
jgi:hypothetical protein